MEPEQRFAEAEAMALVLSHEDRIQRLTDALTRNGFVRCDVPACNCGSWHARFGLPERMAELKQLLDDAGYPLCNENGGLVSLALSALIAERDALRAMLEGPCTWPQCGCKRGSEFECAQGYARA